MRSEPFRFTRILRQKIRRALTLVHGSGLSPEMKEGTYTPETVKRIARAALAMGSGPAVRSISLKEVCSPWDEKVQVRFKAGHTDITLHIWNGPQFLAARVHRLVLYGLDSLSPAFSYDRNAVLAMNLTPRTRETHNHIWSIYVDSRIEKIGLENFFDRTLRRNLFVDSQKTYPWALSSVLFDKLWERGSFTHQEIIDYAHDLAKLLDHQKIWDPDAFEIEINRSVSDHSVMKLVEGISSPALRNITGTLLEFVTSRCRGTLIEPSYYGIYFMYEQEIFAEMVTTKQDALHLTLFDFQLEKHMAYVLTENPQGIQEVQEAMKEIYDKISRHSYLKTLKNPYSMPIER
jgi:hypothetical protein